MLYKTQLPGKYDFVNITISVNQYFTDVQKNETTNGKTSVYISRIKKITSNIYSKLKRPLIFQLHANTHPSFGLPGI